MRNGRLPIFGRLLSMNRNRALRDVDLGRDLLKLLGALHDIRKVGIDYRFLFWLRPLNGVVGNAVFSKELVLHELLLLTFAFERVQIGLDALL